MTDSLSSPSPPAPEWADLVRDRHLHTPALLFLASHRPLAFWAGQLLLLCQPLGFIAPDLPLAQWGALLSHPRGPETLEAILRSTDIPDPTAAPAPNRERRP